MKSATEINRLAKGKRPVTELSVSGMTCNNCARHVSEALQKVPGVENVSVQLEQRRAIVKWKTHNSADTNALLEAINKAGYDATLPASQTELLVEGMTCQNCARQVVEALQRVQGVFSAAANIEHGRAVVKWQPNFPPDEEQLLEALHEAGYAAQIAGETSESKTNHWSPFAGWRFNVVFGSIVTVPLMIAEWGFRAGMERWYHWLAFALVLPVQVFCGARFYRGAWNQLKIGSSNMDTLVVLGSTTAFAYSTWALFSGWNGHLFFMESAAIITLISAGHWVETNVSKRAAASLRALLNLAPQKARLLEKNGLEVEVPVSQLKIGDKVILKPGDRVPTDGEVLEGLSTIDESMLTGESVPVDKRKGVKVYAGTINLHGWLLSKVVATGDATALAQIISVVQRAQNSRANIQKLGDRVSSVFVPVVVLIAIATGLWWALAPESAMAATRWMEGWLWPAHHPEGPIASAIYHAAAVLIIACPCAMGLATPVAIMAGTNVASERGILIRDGIALEKTGQLSAVLFDKTGTLTQGKITVVAAEDFTAGEMEKSGLYKIAASLAKPSLHPLSQAVATLSNVVLPLSEWKEERGSGVLAKAQAGSNLPAGAVLRMGSLKWLSECGVGLEMGMAFVQNWTSKGATVLGLALDERLIGVLALRDVIKDNARQVVEQLQRKSKAVYLVTGDNKPTAIAIAQQVGISPDRVYSEVRPEAKASIVLELQKRGERVAFIGDGINDAPALEQADLGIAVSRASDVAREAADIILLNSDISVVPETLALAQATLRTIKQNLFWAFFYNVVGIPLAVFGFLSPVFSALAMGLSDLIVIGNALRLRRWRYEK